MCEMKMCALQTDNLIKYFKLKGQLDERRLHRVKGHLTNSFTLHNLLDTDYS